jgi:hypothetical protein
VFDSVISLSVTLIPKSSCLIYIHPHQHVCLVIFNTSTVRYCRYQALRCYAHIACMGAKPAISTSLRREYLFQRVTGTRLFGRVDSCSSRTPQNCGPQVQTNTFTCCEASMRDGAAKKISEAASYPVMTVYNSERGEPMVAIHRDRPILVQTRLKGC